MRKRQILQKGQKTRELILEGAARLFATRGYHGTSVNDLVEELGIAKGTLYQYFPSKDDVFNELKRQFYKDLVAFFETQFRGSVGALNLPRSRLELRTHLNRSWIELWNLLVPRKELALLFFGEMLHRNQDFLVALKPLDFWIQELKNRGSSRSPVASSVLAFTIVQSFVQLLNRYVWVEKRNISRADFVDQCVQMNLDLLRSDV